MIKNSRGLIVLILIIGTAICLAGCQKSYRVKWVGNKDVTALCAEDIVIMMNRAGFEKDEILELGTDVRNALASKGAARAMIDDKTEAIFVVEDKRVYVNSQKRGKFIYDIKKKVCH